MELFDLLGALAIGFAAGMAGGLVGVGGGVLMVPGLVIFLGESQLGAEATSLLAIVGVAAVGAWRQNGYGNLRLRDAMVIGALSPIGVLVGTVLANALSERALELSFAAVQVYFAYRLVRRATTPVASPGAAKG
ncbi:MAG: sulfite exporter TauE/SafE family protein [Actinomycetota bacterium]|nr:sulfite exporter TauE/SafE family protein [Actinomycetota bacterium]